MLPAATPDSTLGELYGALEILQQYAVNTLGQTVRFWRFSTPASFEASRLAHGPAALNSILCGSRNGNVAITTPLCAKACHCMT